MRAFSRAGGATDVFLGRLIRRLVRWGLLLALAGAVLVVAGFFATVLYLERELPDVASFDDYRRTARQVTRILSTDGTLLAEIFVERRTVVDVRHLPRHVTDAVLAAEDGEFWHHPGIDLLGIARALWTNLRAGRVRQGGSTITQQVAKTFYLTPERTLGRKLRELVLARRLEQRLTKQDILGLYLNQIYFGHGRYGIEEAARFYFGHPARDLRVEEAALLAGIIPAPERYTPLRDPEAARARRDQVLRRMVQYRFLAEPEATALAALPVRTRVSHPPDLGLGGYFAAAVQRELTQRFGADRVWTGGLTVETTLAPRLQRAAEAALAGALERVDRTKGFGDPVSRGTAGKLAAKDGVREAVVTSVEPAAERYQVALSPGVACLPFAEEARYREEGAAPGSRYRPGDVLLVRPRPPVPGEPCPVVNLELGPQGALVAMDTRTREVRALVGGTDAVARPFDRATQARRQAGSTFKPFVYAAGLETGAISADSRFPNRLVRYRGAGGRPWAPRNYDGVHDGREVTVSEALARSLNVVAVQVLRVVGIAPTLDLARRLGLPGPFAQDLTLALGSPGVSLLALTNAYATLAALGRHRDPVLVTRVLDSEGREIYRAGAVEGVQALPADVARTVDAMLARVVEEGTGKAARLPGVRVSGKTGTTDDGVDAWFVGTGGPLTAGVWLGFDDRRPLGGTGGELAAPLWAAFAREALGLPPEAQARR